MRKARLDEDQLRKLTRELKMKSRKSVWKELSGTVEEPTPQPETEPGDTEPDCPRGVVSDGVDIDGAFVQQKYARRQTDDVGGLSFARDLWDQFSKLERDARLRCRVVAGFARYLKARAAAESEYARRLEAAAADLEMPADRRVAPVPLPSFTCRSMVQLRRDASAHSIATARPAQL